MADKFSNFMQSIPNDDDLDQAYFWERKSILDAEDLATEQALRTSKCGIALPVTWRGLVKIKNIREWRTVFLCVQGRRLVWWENEATVEKTPPHGYLLLSALSAVTEASPLDEREVGLNDSRQLFAVFGSDVILNPIKCTILCKSSGDRCALEGAIARHLH